MDNELQEWSNLWQSEKENDMIKMIHIGEKLSKVRTQQKMQIALIWVVGLGLALNPLRYFAQSGFSIENIVFAGFMIPYGIGSAIWYTRRLLRVEKTMSQNPDAHVGELQARLEQSAKLNKSWWSLWTAGIFSIGFIGWIMTRHFEAYSRAPMISLGIIGAVLAILVGSYFYQRYAIGKSEQALREFEELVGES